MDTVAALLVRDVDTSSKVYEAILGDEPQSTVDREGRMRRLFFIKGAWIQVREPRSGDERDHLERYGQGPHQVSLRSKDGPVGPADGSIFDPALFSGAKITVL